MKIFKLITLILILSTYSCAYNKYAEIQKKHIETEQVRMKEQTKVVMAAYQMIIRIMFPSAVDLNIVKNDNTDSYLVNHLWYDDQGRKQLLQIKDTSQSQTPSSDKFMAYIMFKELIPALHEIYRMQQLNIEAPVTIGSVLMKAAEAIPMLGAIAGPIITAGLLADQGVKVAGNTITNGSSVGAGKGVHSNPSYNYDWMNPIDHSIREAAITSSSDASITQ